MDTRFANKAILISGATSGIGEATARAFVAHGAEVFGIGRRPEAIEEAAGRTRAVRWIAADVRRAEDARRAVEEVRRARDRIDVLVNNAGAFFPAPLGAATPEQIEAEFATNVFGASHLTRAALPLLEASRGSVVNVSSAAARKPSPGFSHYAASKAALESLTRSWALELAPRGVRVNAIAPGPTATPALEKAGLPAEAVAALRRQLEASLPLGRAASADEIALWIVHLADASWMTGHVLAFDGGMSLT